MKIYFVTGNARKVGEAKLACESAGIEIVQQQVEIDEIQSTNPSTISIGSYARLRTRSFVKQKWFGVVR